MSALMSRRWLPLLLLLSALLPLAESLRTTNSSAASEDKEPKGKIFFLMLADDGIELEDIWVNFLAAGGKHGLNYRFFIHCTNPEGCKQNITRKDLFELVPTVPSVYCSDLVSPMLALLAAAYNHSEKGNPHDKFVFVSDNSVPLKPFWKARRILTVGHEGIASFSWATDEKCGFFKASQWFVLSNWHAGRMLSSAAQKKPKLAHQCLDWQCLDENWPLVAIYGEEELLKWPTIPRYLKSRPYWWIDWDNPGKMVAKSKHEGPKGPATVTSVSRQGLEEWESSEQLLFARKFIRTATYDGNMSLAEAFNKYLFKTTTHD